MTREVIQVVSPSFSNGGAERVLAILVNIDCNFSGYSLSPTTDYLGKSAMIRIAEKSTFSSIPILRLLRSLWFIRTNTSAHRSFLISCWKTLILVKLAHAGKSLSIGFRPSIDAHFITRDIKATYGLLQWPIISILKFTLKSCYLICQTDAIRKSMVGLKYKKILVLSNPVTNPLPAFELDQSRRPQIIYAGRGTWWKGIDRFFQAVNLDTYRECRWNIYGNLDIDLSSRAGCIKHISINGWTQTSDFEHRNSILFLPSRIEGFPNIVLEALAAMWPVIVSQEAYDCFNGLAYIQHSLFVVNCDNLNNKGITNIANNLIYCYNYEARRMTRDLILEKHSALLYANKIKNFLWS